MKGGRKGKATKSRPKSVKTSQPAKSVPINEHHSVSVEKISNGFLIRTSADTSKGYESKTTYSKTKPNISLGIGGQK